MTLSSDDLQPPPFSSSLEFSPENYAEDDPSQATSELPAYSRPSPVHEHTSREQTDHNYSLKTSNDHDWLKLTVKSWASSAKHLPVYMEGTPIVGQVELDLLKPDGIKAIIIAVKGAVVASQLDSKLFLSVSQILWDASMGDPRSPSSPQAKHTEKLRDKYTFPFSISLPERIHLTGRAAKDLGLSGNERLPPSLGGGGWHSFINYELTVVIKRHGAFSIDSLLTTLIGYTPCTRPEPLSVLRQQAYQENTQLLGPDVDPMGWNVFPDIEIHGTVFKARKVIITCSLALATPLSYVRGSIIPCTLAMSCWDKQALELVSNSQAPVIQIRRKLKTHMGVENVGGVMARPNFEANAPLSRAAWVPRTAVAENSDMRVLYGELNLPPSLVPTFDFGSFENKYVVDMYPPTVPGFVPSSEDRLFRTEVSITSMHSNGTRPRALLPPGYGLSQEAPRERVADSRRNLRLNGFA